MWQLAATCAIHVYIFVFLLWPCMTQRCFHRRFNSLNSGAIGSALIHVTELGSAPFHGQRCGKPGTFLLEINWWVIAPSEHMHTHLYLLPSKLPIKLQQELNCLVCCFALLLLKAKLDKRLLGNWHMHYCIMSRCRWVWEGFQGLAISPFSQN